MGGVIGEIVLLAALTLLLYVLAVRMKKNWNKLGREQRSAMFASLLMLGCLLAIYWYSAWNTLLALGL